MHVVFALLASKPGSRRIDQNPTHASIRDVYGHFVYSRNCLGTLSAHRGEMMEIFTYANCTSCRNAEALATKHGIETTKRDIFKERLSVEELNALFTRIGTSPRQMIATRSRPYRDLGLADKNLSDAEILVLMAEY